MISPRLTIAIPFYSNTLLLRRAIDSVRAQTVLDWRCLVCDDGSTPGVDSLVASYADERILYYKNSHNLGMAANWNRCIELTETELVTLLHADDELLPDYAATMLRTAADRPEAGILCCGAEIIGADHRPRFSFPDFVKTHFVNPTPGRDLVLQGESGTAALLRGNFIVCPTMCFRRSAVALRFRTDLRFAQDWDLVLDYLLAGGSVVILGVVCYRYRRHADNATVRYTESLYRFEEESAVYDRLLEAADTRGWLDCASTARRRSLLKLNLGYVALASLGTFHLRQGARGLRLLGRLCVRGTLATP